MKDRCLSSLSEAQKQSVVFMMFRLVLAVGFLQAAFEKLSGDSWSASGYLLRAQGFFGPMFQAMAGNGIVDGLVVYGELFIGIAFLVGIFVRPAAFFGALMMVLFYASGWPTNALHGVVNVQLLYFVSCVFLMTQRSGNICCVDMWLKEQSWVKSQKWMKMLF